MTQKTIALRSIGLILLGSGILLGSFIARWRLTQSGEPWNGYLFIGLSVGVLVAYFFLAKMNGVGNSSSENSPAKRYRILADALAFMFFGVLGVGGSYILFTKEWSWDMLFPVLAVGLLSVSVLNLNNMRDIESDRLSDKKTVALHLGFKLAMIYQMVLMQLPLILILIFLMMNNLHTAGNYYPFMVMILFFPMTALRRRIMQTKNPKDLHPFLKQIGILTLVMAVLVAVGLNMQK